MSYSPTSFKLLGILKAANLNTTADQNVTILSQKPYIIKKIMSTNASAAPSLASGSFYTAINQGGDNLLGGTIGFGPLSDPTQYQESDCILTNSLTLPAIYLNLSVANGTACTCDVYLWGYELQ